ncbi:MAG: hypothetical protein IAC07_02985 [Bacteroidetes bacterium]|uniref:Outer membrane protein beta-barrel domain-containing protein n=1 Tax=Candidatus Cryptobacteroides gallistercoris TaxID=2840765 RepID=A0A940DML0_9BACT|nr:hypothetical protein [Candidatus Cryptobacteroides gallistercoris]
MKRIILSAAIAVMAVISATAQPRAVGARLGASGFEASYQHTLGSNFIEADLGLDYLGRPGFKAEALYNFVFARPAWTDRGTWGLYAGPGLALGYVEDIVHWKTGNPGIDNTYRNWRGHDYGFMMSVTGQIGLEYTFWFPLQLSVDIRPYIGFHVSESGFGTGFYNNGLFGFIPTVSARYRF